MYDATILVCAVVGTIAAVITVLPLFGLDLRLRGRSDKSNEISAYPKNRREKRLWIAVALALVSVGLSCASFYRFERPRILERTTEKIVEKPVDRIVEKVVQAECPKSRTKVKPKSPSVSETTREPNTPFASSPPPPSQNCPNGICVGGENSGSATVNNFGPPPITFQWKTESMDSTKAGFPHKTMVTITPSDTYTPVSLAIVCDVELQQEVRFDFGTNASALLSPSSGVTLEDKKIAYVKFGGTAVTPDTPLFVYLWSKEPLQVLRIVQAKIRLQ